MPDLGSEIASRKRNADKADDAKKAGQSHAPFFRNTAFQYALQIARYIFPFITIPYLTRVLGPDAFAIRSYVLAFMTLMTTVLDFGFSPYGTKHIAENRTDLQLQSEITSAIALLRIALCVFSAVIVAAISQCIPILAENPIYVLLAYITICFKAMLPDFVFQGLEDMGIITWRYIATQLVAIILIFLLVKSPEQLLLIPAIEGLAALIALLWSWADVFLRRRIRLIRVAGCQLLNAIKLSAFFFVSAAATYIYNSLTTIMIGLYIQDPALISYWSLAITAMSAVQMLYTPISSSLYPHMCASRDFRFARRLILLGTPFALVGAIAFYVFSEPIMLILGGEDYLAGSSVIALLSPTVFLSFFSILLGNPVLAAIGELRKLMLSSVLAGVFHIVGLLVLLLIGLFNIEAIAILRCVTEAVLAISRVVSVLRVRAKGDICVSARLN